MGKLANQLVQDVMDELLLQLHNWVRKDPGACALRQQNFGVLAQLLGPAVNSAVDGYPGIGGEGCPTCRVIALDRVPQPNPACLQRFLVGNLSASLALNEGMHQSVMLLHRLLDSLCCQPLRCTFAHEIPPLL